MADIELVIKIPEGLKKDFESEQWTALSCMEMKNALENGTPLSKEHGRLIDADATLKRHCTELCAEKPSCYEDCLIYDLLHLAPTIIEADKGEQK